MPEPNFIQRKCSHCEDEEAQRKPLNNFIQKKEAGGKNVASDAAHNQIQLTRGSGNPMPEGTKTFMESRFGTDFSNVRIHSGAYASQLSDELNAEAFTVGSDIYFNHGKFSPGDSAGKRLLAHELTHTIQQGNIGRNSNYPRSSGNVIHKKPLPAPRKTIWINVGFDSSAKANKETMKKIRASITLIKSDVANCCSAKKTACNIDVKTRYDWNRANKPAPVDHDYDTDTAADNSLDDTNLGKIAGHKGGLNILVTESTISQSWQGKRISSRANTGDAGVLWSRKDAAEDTIAHEAGHAAKYSGGDIDGGVHSSDPDNLMSGGDIRNEGALPDNNWCQQMETMSQ